MTAKFLDNIYNKLCENKNIKESLLNIKKYIDYSFIFLYKYNINFNYISNNYCFIINNYIFTK